jgi:tellurium resistance protein TerD
MIYFIFYNQIEGSEGAVHYVTHDQGAAFHLDLKTLSYDVVKIVFCMSIHEAALRDQYVGQLRSIQLRIFNDDTGAEMANWEVSPSNLNDKLCYALMTGALIREGGNWQFSSSSEDVQGGLSKAATKYGLMVTG